MTYTIKTGIAYAGERAYIFKPNGTKRSPRPHIKPSQELRAGTTVTRVIAQTIIRDGRAYEDSTAFRSAHHAQGWYSLIAHD